ncbi:MAG TPA: YetF domain-containing protein [Bacillota bacterium]
MGFLKGFLHGAKDLPFWILAIRAVFLYIALIIATRLMGYRQVGILTGHNYLVAAGIVSLAAIRMISPESSFVSGVVIIFCYAGVNILLSYLDLKLPKLVDRLPVVLMRGGILDRRMLSDAHITLENLLGQLRLKEASDLTEIDTLVLEPTGKLSVIKKPKYLPVTRQMMKLPAKNSGLPVALIFDGQIQTENLVRLGHDRRWLEQELAKQGFSSPKSVFLAMLNPDGTLYTSA